MPTRFVDDSINRRADSRPRARTRKQRPTRRVAQDHFGSRRQRDRLRRRPTPVGMACRGYAGQARAEDGSARECKGKSRALAAHRNAEKSFPCVIVFDIGRRKTATFSDQCTQAEILRPSGPNSITSRSGDRPRVEGQAFPIEGDATRRCRSIRRAGEPGSLSCSRSSSSGRMERTVIRSRTVSFAVSPQAVQSARSQASMSLWFALTRNLPLARKRPDPHTWQRRRTRGRQVGTTIQFLSTEVHLSQ